jgi:hypothetical protein
MKNRRRVQRAAEPWCHMTAYGLPHCLKGKPAYANPSSMFRRKAAECTIPKSIRQGQNKGCRGSLRWQPEPP